MLLNNRLSDLLDQSIEQYIRTAIPVASGAISARIERARSPATIRNDLKILEELGYLRQVHAASGGRVPTAQAYAEYLSLRDTSHYSGHAPPAFVASLIEDLQELSGLVARIERKLAGSVNPLIRVVHDDASRKINFQKLFEDPNLQMSAIYLVIKEKIDNGKI